MFVALVEELAEVFVAAGIDAVAGDAVEGFNPSHDVCRFVIDGAVALASRRTGRPIDNRDFVLEARPDTCPEASRDAATWIRLDDAALDCKIDAALHAPSCGPRCTARWSASAAAPSPLECLRPVTAALAADVDSELPFYERYGEQRVREGRYAEIIRHRQHVLPVRAAIEAAIHGRTADPLVMHARADFCYSRPPSGRPTCLASRNRCSSWSPRSAPQSPIQSPRKPPLPRRPAAGRRLAPRSGTARQPWLVGANFTTSTAINQLEMWQADTFEPAPIDRELGWAKGIGMNTMRVYLHDLLWRQDAGG